MTALSAGISGICNAAPITMPLWPDGVPWAMGNKPEDKPDITVYLPEASKASGAAVLICPGGGYGCLCSSYEGHDIAKWLNSYGIAGVVLKYRISPYRHPVPLQDAQRAMKIVRSHAKDWNLDSDKIGVMGFSAGGHLASTLGTHYMTAVPSPVYPEDAISCRPSFMILIYPVITMRQLTHGGSRNNLLGASPTQAQIDEVSNELHVTKDTPPAFLAHSVKDSAVTYKNSVLFADAMKANGVPVEYLELPSGEHGLGCGKGKEWEQWQTACSAWLRNMKLVRQ